MLADFPEMHSRAAPILGVSQVIGDVFSADQRRAARNASTSLKKLRERNRRTRSK
jgi:hypothetical protein